MLGVRTLAVLKLHDTAHIFFLTRKNYNISTYNQLKSSQAGPISKPALAPASASPRRVTSGQEGFWELLEASAAPALGGNPQVKYIYEVFHC